MGVYSCTRVWQLKPGATASDLEALATSGILEIQRWITGIEHVTLLRIAGEPQRYLMIFTFTNHESYVYWRQVQEEASDYWEHFASILMYWEQLCFLVEEYAGELTDGGRT